MLPNSLQFLVFFPLVVLAWFAVPQRYKSPVLLAASLWFYASWNPLFLLALFVCIAVAWLGGLWMAAPGTVHRRWVLAISILVPLLILGVFKYYNFIAESAMFLARRFDSGAAVPVMHLALPVGISFFTFKTVSYLIDVHRGTIKAEKNVLPVANYIAFFPQILAGPIERAGNFIPQLAHNHRPDPSRIRDGCALFLWGLFKKVVVADNLAIIVNMVYADPHNYPGMALAVATYCYAFQIFCDFSGYTDMATGAARIMGISTMRNFNHPYAAVSVTDFWRRWHISLSTWFRDYLYIPLGGNRLSYGRWVAAIMIVFVVSGLWHGASWTFVIWGALHGLFIVVDRLFARPLERAQRRHPRIVRFARVLLTFHLVTFAWIFFRASSIGDAIYIAGHLFDGMRFEVLNLFQQADLIRAAVLIAIVLAAQYLRHKESGFAWLRTRPAWLRWTVYTALIIAVMNLRPLAQSGFIYLQF